MDYKSCILVACDSEDTLFFDDIFEKYNETLALQDSSNDVEEYEDDFVEAIIKKVCAESSFEFVEHVFTKLFDCQDASYVSDYYSNLGLLCACYHGNTRIIEKYVIKYKPSKVDKYMDLLKKHPGTESAHSLLNFIKENGYEEISGQRDSVGQETKTKRKSKKIKNKNVKRNVLEKFNKNEFELDIFEGGSVFKEFRENTHVVDLGSIPETYQNFDPDLYEDGHGFEDYVGFGDVSFEDISNDVDFENLDIFSNARVARMGARMGAHAGPSLLENADAYDFTGNFPDEAIGVEETEEIGLDFRAISTEPCVDILANHAEDKYDASKDIINDFDDLNEFDKGLDEDPAYEIVNNMPAEEA
jgi:hypothetical protein